ncbi:response regulator [Methanoregula sp.]|uniref:response regulator n=1 Tax=Methanoregula sp. TaxID=2052170 RepID=UPI002C28940B|nr:response regulator [Methanoregula sp.]HVP97583.1 response regulator [Methanoregula sp.]
MEKRPPTILIVEDELIVAENLRLVLSGMGYEVPEPAGTSSEALERAASLAPDLILMDIVLEGSPMDGIETAKKIGQMKDVPVIFVTAYSDKKTLSRVKGTEPYAYILKPFNERELAFAIELALHRYQLDREIKKRDSLLLAISFAIEWFLRRHASVPSQDPGYEKNLSAGIMEILEHIGFAVHAASVCIFRMNPGREGRDGATVQYLWVDPGITGRGKISLSSSESITFTSILWSSLLGSGNTIAGDVKKLPGTEGRFFEDRGISSIAVLPLFRNDTLWGFVGFSDTVQREWSDSEMETLQIAGNLIGAVLK